MAPKRTRAEVEAELAELDAAEQADEPEFEYEIGRGDNYARVSSKSKAGQKLAAFFKDSFGIDLADEVVQDDDAKDDDAKDEPKRKAAGRQQQGGQVKAFQRRIS